jgi:alanine racemase
VRSEHAPAFVEAVSRLKHLSVVGLCSHFATSGVRDRVFANEQLNRINSVIEKIRTMGIEIPLTHMANSGAILDLPEAYFSMVRPGLMLYGAYPTRETTESIPLTPVMELKSNVVFVKEVPPATSISYGREYFTKSRTTIGTVPVGYGDGYSRRLTHKAEVLVHGRRFPVVGTICMDQFMVDLGLDSDIHVGDEVTLMGTDGNESISAWDIADNISTIPYEIFTGIAERVPRVYIS